MTDTLPRAAAPWRLAAAGLSLIAVCYGLARFAFGLFTPAFRAAFGLDAAAIGLIAALGYAAYCVGVGAATFGTPRWGARSVAVAAGLLATAGTIIVGSSADAVTLGIGAAIGGASTGVASPALADAVAKGVTPARRDRVQSVINAGTGLGVLVAGPIALLLLDQWRVAWFVFAGLAAATTLWAAVAVPAGRTTPTGIRAAPPEARAESAAARTSPDTSRGIPGARTRALRLPLASLLLGAGSGAVWTFGQDALAASLGRPLATVGWIVLGACGLLGAAAGDVIRRLGVNTAWRVFLALMAISTTIIAVLSHLPALAIPAAGVFGAVYIAATGVLLIAGTRIRPDDPARGVGSAFLLLAVGQAASSPGWGALGDVAGLPVTLLGATATTIVALLIAPLSAGAAHASTPRKGDDK
ncbi:MFS transporter [uncultured Microbacterium sp.]|uniref:MFS transporter n=1 Tax=uncultured Microbacterium sp. TaxID=191216 RepID=UPI0028DBE818|nr:MFS transporter [uncultured Microbacterium sp.]